jgi:hypothetical protein
LEDVGGTLDKDHVGRTAGCGLKTEGAAPGKKIQASTAFN